MKNCHFYFLALSALLIFLFGCTAADSHLSGKPSLNNNETRIYEVFGMDCPGCHGGLEKLVKKIPAVEEADANWLEKQVVITTRPGTELNDGDVYDAIRRANFTPGKRVQ